MRILESEIPKRPIRGRPQTMLSQNWRFLTASLGSSGLRNNYFVLLRFWEQFAKCAAKQKKHKNCIILFLKNQQRNEVAYKYIK